LSDLYPFAAASFARCFITMPTCSDVACKAPSLPLLGLFNCALCEDELHLICGSRVQQHPRYHSICSTCRSCLLHQNEVLREQGLDEVSISDLVQSQNSRRLAVHVDKSMSHTGVSVTRSSASSLASTNSRLLANGADGDDATGLQLRVANSNEDATGLQSRVASTSKSRSAVGVARSSASSLASTNSRLLANGEGMTRFNSGVPNSSNSHRMTAYISTGEKRSAAVLEPNPSSRVDKRGRPTFTHQNVAQGSIDATSGNAVAAPETGNTNSEHVLLQEVRPSCISHNRLSRGKYFLPIFLHHVLLILLVLCYSWFIISFTHCKDAREASHTFLIET
jgi:hypothetical protein